jgi:hypothetical protein
MVLIGAGVIILALCGAAAVIIGRQVPVAAMVGPEELSQVRSETPLYRKILGSVRAEQRALLLKMMLKIVHRMRVLSLRADSASGRLIDYLRAEHRSSEQEAHQDAIEARQEAFVNKLLEHNINDEAYAEIADFYRAPRKGKEVPQDAVPRATLADVKSRKKRTVVK